MSSSKNPSNSANQDDPWEQLAEDLFGLEYGKEHASLESTPPPIESESDLAPESHKAVHSSREDSGSGALAPREEPPRFAADAIEKAEPAFEDDDDMDADAGEGDDSPEEFEESSEGAAVEPAAEQPASPQDSYWDALANWNWDESEGGAGRPRSGQSRSTGGPPPRGGPKGRDEGRGRRGGDRPQRQSTPAAASPTGSPPSPPPRQPAPSATDDFGLGVANPKPGFSPPAEAGAVERRPPHTARYEGQSATGSTPEVRNESTSERSEVRGEIHGGDRGAKRPDERGSGAGEEGEPRKRRRRRRRRRGARGEPGGISGTTPAVQGTAHDDSAGPEADLPEEESEEESEADLEGSGEPMEAIAEERPSPPARGRRHGRRPEERPSGPASDRSQGRFVGEEEEPQEIVLAGGGAGETEQDSDHDDDADDESEEQKVSYEDVPTWEEAISYLLHPNQVQVEGGGSPGGSNPPRGSQPADQPRQTRHIGHRKHRG